MKRSMPTIPREFQGPPWSQGPRYIRCSRRASAPCWATNSSGAICVPRLLLILVPSSARIMPWLRRRRNGSPCSIRPRSRITLVKKRVQPQGIGAVLRDQLVRSNLRAPALAHLGPLFGQDHALVAQAQEGLAVLDETEVADDLGEEARVEQMEDGVLDAAAVEIDRSPARGRLRVERPGLFVRR